MKNDFRQRDWTRAELLELTEQLLFAQEAMRSALARELHGELGAVLTGLAVDLSRLKPGITAGAEHDNVVESSRTLLRQAVALKRDFIERLYPSTLQLLGLGAALSAQASEFRARHRVDAMAVIADPEPTVAPSVAIDLFRLAQAALENIALHAAATEVEVRFAATVDNVILTVADNGVGFDVAATEGAGIRLMQFRINRWGGKFAVESGAGRGTRVIAHLDRGRAREGVHA